MSFKIVNIVDTLDQVNFGIWNAAVATSAALKEYFDIESYLVFPESSLEGKYLGACTPVPVQNLWSLKKNPSFTSLPITPGDTIIVTHGTWQYPTRWGYQLYKQGFHWVYTPHGMLEPWQLQQKRIKKALYLRFLELPYSRRASLVRAVGSPEKENLLDFYGEDLLKLIPNGVPSVSPASEKDTKPRKVVYMGRLHHKKGVTPLVKAWKRSKLFKNSWYELIIAGPDHGELSKIRFEMQGSDSLENIRYIGPRYGKDKMSLLEQASFFILPSQSEGFPTSILEAMQYGAVPVVSEGCNFPELLAQPFSISTTHLEEDIVQSLNKLDSYTDETLRNMSRENQTFVNENYSIEEVARQQYHIFKSLLSR